MSVTDPSTPDPEPSGLDVYQGMSERQQRELYAVMLAYWEKTIGKAREEGKADIEEPFLPGGKSPVYLTLPGGRVKLGEIRATDPQPSVVVVDHEAFMDWVQLFYPTEVEEDTVVIPEQVIPASVEYTRSLRAAFFKEFKVAPTGDVVLGPDGETDIPGLKVKRAAPHTVSVNPNHKVIAAVWSQVRGIVPAVLDAPKAERVEPVVIEQEQEPEA